MLNANQGLLVEELVSVELVLLLVLVPSGEVAVPRLDLVTVSLVAMLLLVPLLVSVWSLVPPLF